jgi:glycine cleavage system aminomethyltransferase T
MALADEIRAVRGSVALTESVHTTCLRVSGAAAFDTLARVCASDLFLQDAQMRPSLLLGEDGIPFADVYVCRDDEDFFLLSEGPPAADLIDHVRAHASPGDLTIRNLSETHMMLSLHGPYAWELLGECLGPDLVGQPYLSLCRTGEGVICFRGGKTGEYGYDLLVNRGDAPFLCARLWDLGRAFDADSVSLDALDLCALENGFFNIRREGRAGLDPLELQLQWRVTYAREYVGAAALRARRAAGLKRRVTHVIAGEPLAAGDAVVFADKPIGALLQASASPLRGDWVALALLDLPYAHAGIDRYVARRGDREVPLRTVSPPLINNRSLYVSPQRHGYRARAGDGFPTLVV